MSTQGLPDDLLGRAAMLAQDLASWAIVRTSKSRVSMTTTKSNPADFVTDIDTSVERWVRETIARHFPHHAFVGEEFGCTEPEQLTWYCDPVDGTTNFAAGVPWHSFSLALADADGGLVGVVGDPRTQDVYLGIRGRGAWLNGTPLHISPRSPNLAGSLVVTEWLGCLPWPGQFEVMAELGRQYCTVRIMGSTTLSVAGLAAGRGNGAIIGRFGAVDLMAATLICHEAGLSVRDQHNQDTLFPTEGGIVVAHPGLVEQLYRVWQLCAVHAAS